MSVIDFKTTALKSQIEKYYEQKLDVYELPDISNSKDFDNPNVLKEKIEKSFPGMEFSVNTVQGVVEYKDDPKLVYNKNTKNYSFEVKREIKFKKNIPFQSLELSIRLNFFKIIFQSLIIGSVIATLLILPVLIFYVNKMIKPIIDISKASTKIAAGDLGVQVVTNSKDEIGNLSESFNYMSKELSKVKTIRDDLLATVSHELRSPLGRIRGYTELMLDIELENEEKNTYYRSILSEVDLLNSMAAEIIEVSRLELKKERLFLEKADMGFFFEILEEDLEITAKMRNVTIRYNYDYNIFCNIDVEKLRRVIVNVIQNAINANSKNILINTITAGKKYIIEIIDDGKGLAEEYFELVFEKFYRVDKARDRESGGFGLGLAICRGIINEHNGKMYFAKVEKGTKLVIELDIVIE